MKELKGGSEKYFVPYFNRNKKKRRIRILSKTSDKKGEISIFVNFLLNFPDLKFVCIQFLFASRLRELIESN